MIQKSPGRNSFIIFSYEHELHFTTRSSIRQGTIFGIFAGWLSFSTYLVYSIGFIFGSIFMFYYDKQDADLADITIVIILEQNTYR